VSDVELDYDGLTRQALLRVVHDVLEITAELGHTPGAHHFHIEFETQAAGVSMPESLREEYPERMTIVLQHQFENLQVSERSFGVTLRFKGREARLEIPFDALTLFADPFAAYQLRFAAPTAPPFEEKPAAAPAPGDSGQEAEASSDAHKVVALDAFRKK
jgi:hypothetical protein